MGAMTSDGAGLASGIDLTQFYQVFFEEAGENLAQMEKLLLGLDIHAAGDETLNAIFRCAHSIKGGAATFGFADVAELTHQLEALLDKLRRHEMQPSTAMVDVLLQAGDALRGQLARHQGAPGGPSADAAELLGRVRALLDGADAPAGPAAPTPTSAPGQRRLELTVGPLQRPGDADELQALFREIPGLGTLAPLDGGCPDGGLRRFEIATTSSDSDLLDLFTFHVAREQLALRPLAPQAASGPPTPASEEGGYGFFANAPGAPPATAAAAESATAPRGPAPAQPANSSRTQPAAAESATLRVPLEKVDQLINLVGELVITQTMLAQNALALDPALQQRLTDSLDHLQRNTRDLQESVLSIRMIPMATVFNRFPRMLRDLAAKLGKTIDFVTRGEATELDKGLVEKIIDPLTHLVRNACDHGIETAAERRAAGKPECGTLTLAASHRGGSIVIEVADDGRGLSRPKLLQKARDRGIAISDSAPDGEVWNLIFAPGFSTAGEVTEVSGRGVGMDVVKRNIAALGGTVEIESSPGAGMRVSVRLPLTLAIMDGMSIGVGDEAYVLPLAAVVESLQIGPGTLRTLGGSARVVEVRGEFMPALDLAGLLNVPRRADQPAAIAVVVQADAGRMALLVDELLGQQQVVVKNLEANYRRVDDVSAATIMGDGRVALILDVASLVRRSRH